MITQKLLVAALVATVTGATGAAGAASVTAVQVADTPRERNSTIVRAPQALPIRLAVILAYRHQNDLTALLRAEAQPGSPLAHHALTAQQFATYFAPAPADYERIIAALERHGLNVVQTYADRSLIDVVAPAAAVERTFATEIGITRRADGTLRYLNVLPAYLPGDLTGWVYGVAGFDSGRGIHAMKESATIAGRITNIAPGPPLQGPATGFGPEAYARAYDLPVLHAIPGAPAGTTYDGAKQGVALIAEDDFNESDLTSYLKYFDIARTGPKTQRIPVDGGAQRNGIFSFATTLQAETLVGLAPGVVLRDYGVPEFSDVSLLDAYARINSDDNSAVALSPAYDCEEASVPRKFPQLSDHLAQAGTAMGIVYVTDAGNYNLGTLCKQFTPSTDPSFVAVGGTTLVIDSQAHYKLELASYGSAGGQSQVFALPAYQQHVPNITGPNRNIPDISFDGDPLSGGALLEDGYWTSPEDAPNNELDSELSAAIFTSFVAEWTQFHRSSLGDIHGELYGAYQKYGYTQPKGAPLFHDITLGNGFKFPAVPGYDNATGIGSIDGWNFVQTVHS